MTRGEKFTAGLLATLLLVCFVMVSIGGYVRLSGSGLSIPEWPLFQTGKLDAAGELNTYWTVLPPSTPEGWEMLRTTLVRELPQYEETSMMEFQRMFWIEWSHRATASVISLLYLTFLITWFRSKAVRERLGKLPLWGLALLATQVVLGGFVVLLHLMALKVALHLVTAFMFTSVILWCFLKIVHPPLMVRVEDHIQVPPAPPDQSTILREYSNRKNPVFRLNLLVIHLVVLQIFYGGIMAGTHAAFQLNTWPKMGEQWVPAGLWATGEGLYFNFAENVIFIQFFHRWFAFIVVAAIFLLVLRAMTVKVTPLARWTLRALVSIVVLQVLLGIATLVMKVPPLFALIHQGVGLLLLLAHMVLAYESSRHPVVTEEAQLAGAEAQAALPKGEAVNA